MLLLSTSDYDRPPNTWPCCVRRFAAEHPEVPFTVVEVRCDDRERDATALQQQVFEAAKQHWFLSDRSGVLKTCPVLLGDEKCRATLIVRSAPSGSATVYLDPGMFYSRCADAGDHTFDLIIPPGLVMLNRDRQASSWRDTQHLYGAAIGLAAALEWNECGDATNQAADAEEDDAIFAARLPPINRTVFVTLMRDIRDKQPQRHTLATALCAAATHGWGCSAAGHIGSKVTRHLSEVLFARFAVMTDSGDVELLAALRESELTNRALLSGCPTAPVRKPLLVPRELALLFPTDPAFKPDRQRKNHLRMLCRPETLWSPPSDYAALWKQVTECEDGRSVSVYALDVPPLLLDADTTDEPLVYHSAHRSVMFSIHNPPADIESIMAFASSYVPSLKKSLVKTLFASVSSSQSREICGKEATDTGRRIRRRGTAAPQDARRGATVHGGRSSQLAFGHYGCRAYDGDSRTERCRRGRRGRGGGRGLRRPARLQSSRGVGTDRSDDASRTAAASRR